MVEVDPVSEKPPTADSSERTSSDADEKRLQADKERPSGPPAIVRLDSKLVKAKPDSDDALQHLPPHEREILQRQLHVPEVKVNYFTLFRYATRNDLLIIILSSVCAIGGGAAMPLMTVGPCP